jgi:hypothetical protein
MLITRYPDQAIYFTRFQLEAIVLFRVFGRLVLVLDNNHSRNTFLNPLNTFSFLNIIDNVIRGFEVHDMYNAKHVDPCLKGYYNYNI